MKTEITEDRVTLVAEDDSDRHVLYTTGYTILRQNYSVPEKKDLALNYNKRGKHISVQYNLPEGGYSVREELPQSD